MCTNLTCREVAIGAVCHIIPSVRISCLPTTRVPTGGSYCLHLLICIIEVQQLVERILIRHVAAGGFFFILLAGFYLYLLNDFLGNNYITQHEECLTFTIAHK